ncbi:MAG: GNAT family N-acetyltransferase [Erythrobacter sp.]|nr:GNAT family N-acetyltransferase [Erythrobacter sp.]NNC46906.1 GNAT family N-acetyltransferase [Sphingomonas sp.]RZV52211.1 MAG: GNAT family N-acetyltransferase [Sphingomonadaceae bacterium]
MNDTSPADLSPLPDSEPLRNCPLCPRLVDFRMACRAEYPDWYNAPVPAFGDPDAHVAIVGLAPGKHGANRTGRPFTGDAAGNLLFDTLRRFGLSTGNYDARIDDGLQLKGAIIINAVKCLPPENKPTGGEIQTCRTFFEEQLASLSNVRSILALGKIAHDAACRALGMTLARNKFAHEAEHMVPNGLRLVDSYHCSRYNQNTGRLTDEMFANAVHRAAAHPLKGEEAAEIRTDRLVLRKARPEDLDALHAMLTDVETMAHWSTPPHRTLQESRDWLQSMIDGSGMASADYIIEKDGEVLGKVGPYKLPELGVLVRRDKWGQGIGLEAMSAIITYLRERDFPYLVADIDPVNTASVRLFEKLGFEQSGYKKDAMLYDGKPVDSVYLRKDL